MALKTGLIGAWCESANPWTDQHTNALTLTDNNTVGTSAGKIGTAGVFVLANSESLSRADEALLSIGDIDWTEAVWVQLTSAPAGDGARMISSKIAGDPEEGGRVLFYHKFSGDERFKAVSAGGITITANIFGTPSLSTWYYLQAQHDATNDLMRIRVNDGAWNETTTGGAPSTDDDGNFYLGRNASGQFLDGLVNQYAFWKALKSDADLNAIYNSGNGLAFSSWDAAVGGNLSTADLRRQSAHYRH
jgi:hypothetical protein